MHLAVFSGRKQVVLPSILHYIPNFYRLDRDLQLNHPPLQNYEQNYKLLRAAFASVLLDVVSS